MILLKAAKNMAELEQQIVQQMQKAMQSVYAKSKSDTENEMHNFYQGSPRYYERTGQLGNSTKTTPVSKHGKTVDFSIWLDTTYSYTVPNPVFTERGFPSFYTTPMVFEAAESGKPAAHILGKSGFWKRSSQKIEKNLFAVFARYFK